MTSEDQLCLWTDAWRGLTEEKRWIYYLGPFDQSIPKNRPDKPLLYKELEWAKSRSRFPNLTEGQKIAFAFLVGDSFEPILQSILAYQPDRLVPVVCNFYGSRDPANKAHYHGEDRWKELKKLIAKLPPKELTGKPFIEVQDPVRYVEDTPDAVFAYLKEQLSGEVRDSDQWDVYVDITGAKKTMVAGAFLYAAYSGTKICYVDFDDYDKKSRSPFGFSCWFRNIENLYQSLRLREWERVQTLYTRYDFQNALAVIKDDLAAPDAWKKNYQVLLDFIRLCGEWENGQYRNADDIRMSLPPEVACLAPGAVEVLGRYWPDKGGNMPRRGNVEEFLLTPRALIVYAQDELERCRRLAGLVGAKETRQDARSAFMRAYSVHETLLKARIAILYQQKRFFYVPLGNGQAIDFDRLDDPTYKAIWEEIKICQAMPSRRLLRSSSDDESRYQLGRGEAPTDKQNQNRRLKGAIYRKESGKNFDIPTKINLSDLRDYRNEVIHTYAPIRPGKDREAIDVAEANLNEFIKNWSSGRGEAARLPMNRLAIPSWDELKRACGAEFLVDIRKSTREGG